MSILLPVAFLAFAPVREIRRDLGSRTPVLTFHDVIPERGPDSLWFDCSAAELEGQIRWFRARGAHFVTVAQLYRHLTDGAPLPPKAVCVTFADNYEGFYRYGLPILRRYRVPVAMFVHTGYVGGQQGRPKMTWDQLRELDREGLVTIGSQTVTHPADLRTLPAAKLAWEMRESKATLERRLGHPIPFLAYPNGKYDARVAEAARRAGYLMAFTEVLAPAERSPNIFMVSRYVHTKYRRAWAEAYR